MGFPPADVATLVTMVEHHLLLPDVATRRDLDDPGTIDLVAKAVGDVGTLRLLAALTEGDSLATGPAAWGGWKAQLVADLVERTAHVLERRLARRRAARRVPHRRAPRADGGRRAGARRARRHPHRDHRRPARRLLPQWPACSPCTASACSTPPPTAPTRASAGHGARGSGSSRASGRSCRGTGWSRDLERGLRRASGPHRPPARAGPHLRHRGVRPSATPVRTGVAFDNRASAGGDGHRRARPRLDRPAAPHHPGARRARPRHPLGQGLHHRPAGRRRVLRAHRRRREAHRRAAAARGRAGGPPRRPGRRPDLSMGRPSR